MESDERFTVEMKDRRLKSVNDVKKKHALLQNLVILNFSLIKLKLTFEAKKIHFCIVFTILIIEYYLRSGSGNEVAICEPKTIRSDLAIYHIIWSINTLKKEGRKQKRRV